MLRQNGKKYRNQGPHSEHRGLVPKAAAIAGKGPQTLTNWLLAN
jgi:hypothetical protein